MLITINQIDLLFKLIFKGCTFRVRGTVIMKPNAHISSWEKYIHFLWSFGWTITNIGICGIWVWVQILGHALGSVQAGGAAGNTSAFPTGVVGKDKCKSVFLYFKIADQRFSWCRFGGGSIIVLIHLKLRHETAVQIIVKSLFQYYRYINVTGTPVWCIDMWYILTERKNEDHYCCHRFVSLRNRNICKSIVRNNNFASFYDK